MFAVRRNPVVYVRRAVDGLTSSLHIGRSPNTIRQRDTLYPLPGTRAAHSVASPTTSRTTGSGYKYEILHPCTARCNCMSSRRALIALPPVHAIIDDRDAFSTRHLLVRSDSQPHPPPPPDPGLRAPSASSASSDARLTADTQQVRRAGTGMHLEAPPLAPYHPSPPSPSREVTPSAHQGPYRSCLRRCPQMRFGPAPGGAPKCA